MYVAKKVFLKCLFEKIYVHPIFEQMVRAVMVKTKITSMIKKRSVISSSKI